MRHRSLPELKKFALIIRRHQDLILNYFYAKKKFSSGIVERFNNKAKLTIRRSYGFRSDKLIEIALYHTLGNPPLLEVTHGFVWRGEKKKNSFRRKETGQDKKSQSPYAQRRYIFGLDQDMYWNYGLWICDWKVYNSFWLWKYSGRAWLVTCASALYLAVLKFYPGLPGCFYECKFLCPRHAPTSSI